MRIAKKVHTSNKVEATVLADSKSEQVWKLKLKSCSLKIYSELFIAELGWFVLNIAGRKIHTSYFEHHFFLNFYQNRKLKKYSWMLAVGPDSYVCTNWECGYSLVANQTYSNLHAPKLRRHVSLGHTLA